VGRAHADLPARRRAAGLRRHFTPGEIGGVKITPLLVLAIAVVLLVPIVMVVVSVTVSGPIGRWANIIAAVGLFAFNLIGLPGYPGLYDKFLIAVGLGWNALTVWLAWQWT
jgi:preprotein translocase subunit Sec61beta